jgi:predicted nucleotidyltransferase
MKRELQNFNDFLREAADPSYYQETFYFTVLISMDKDRGGSRDETKNDIRALPEVLTVTLVEKEKGGVQKDLGNSYLSTLKLHIRRPRDVSKEIMMKRLVKLVSRLKGISVLRYKERKPRPRKKAFRGAGSYKLSEGEYYQSPRHMSDLKDDFEELTSLGPQKKGGYPHTPKTPGFRSAPPGAPGGLEEDQVDEDEGAGETPRTAAELSKLDKLYEEILITLSDNERDDLMAFDVQSELNQKIWDENEDVRPGIKGALMDIVGEFMEGLDLDLDIKDIIITGSTANYNWSKFSDIDLHILLDFKEVNEDKEMVKRFFDAVRSNWNKLHNILVKGHEVEIYVQDEKEPHISTGVYSLSDSRWLVKPAKTRPAIDRATALKKMKHLAREVDKLSSIHDQEDYEQSFKMASRLKEKIKKMRQSGLATAGIYSPENLAFKMLRRSGDIEQLFSVYTEAYDKIHSVDQ